MCCIPIKKKFTSLQKVATILLDPNKFQHSISMQKLHRYSSVTTTIQYQSNFITKKTDEALDDEVRFFSNFIMWFLL